SHGHAQAKNGTSKEWNKSGRGACPRRCLDWISGGKPLFLTCSNLSLSIDRADYRDEGISEAACRVAGQCTCDLDQWVGGGIGAGAGSGCVATRNREDFRCRVAYDAGFRVVGE